MLTFTLAISIFVGADLHKFNVTTPETFFSKEACQAAGDRVSRYVSSRVRNIPRSQVTVIRSCGPAYGYPV